jgi:hypothetical protein
MVEQQTITKDKPRILTLVDIGTSSGAAVNKFWRFCGLLATSI